MTARYTEDGSVCLTDVCRGIVSCMVDAKSRLGKYDYQPIPKHHTRRIRERELELKMMREFYDHMQRELRRLQAAGVEVNNNS